MNVVMRQLNIIGGAGINMGISDAIPEADQLLGLTYQKVSTGVYNQLPAHVRNLFSAESFDYILGGLITVNLAIEKTKQDMKRFRVNEAAFMDLFRQSDLQQSIATALTSIEDQLTISLNQLTGVIDRFDPVMTTLFQKYDSINYFTLNFDAILDHIIYGRAYVRRRQVTDFWPYGALHQGIWKKAKIYHLHGDLRYKPHKTTAQAPAVYRWPVLVVGDQEVKMGIINSNESLRFFNQRFMEACNGRGVYGQNDLAVIGFGFRPEDDHIIQPLVSGINAGVFDSIAIYDVEDRLRGLPRPYGWADARRVSLIEYLQAWTQ